MYTLIEVVDRRLVAQTPYYIIKSFATQAQKGRGELTCQQTQLKA
jgi:hypothetical protein